MSAGDSYFSKALTYSNRKLLSEFRAGTADVSFDTIVGTGLSGTVYVSRVAPTVGSKFAIVRKPDDQSTHSCYRIEGSVGLEYIIADDFVYSGRTVRRVIERMREEYPWSKFMGVWTYEAQVFKSRAYILDRWRWADEVIHGAPMFGPLTYQEMCSKTYGYPVLYAPENGWTAA